MIISPFVLVHSANALLLFLCALAMFLWHLPVLGRLSLADKCIRFGLIVLLTNSAMISLMNALGRPFWLGYIIRLGAASVVLTGFVMVLWKYRYRREVAALQPHLGYLKGPPPPKKES